MNPASENICTCTACRYTFNATVICHNSDSIPRRCPDCGKKSVDGHPAVRAATAGEIEEYHCIQAEILLETAEGL